jgi:hypothetical protein
MPPDADTAVSSLSFCRPVTSPPEHSSVADPSSQVKLWSSPHATLLAATTTVARRPCHNARMQACKRTLERGSPPYPLPNMPLCFAPSHSRGRLRFPLSPLPPSSPRRRPPATPHQSPHRQAQWEQAPSSVARRLGRPGQVGRPNRPLPGHSNGLRSESRVK